MVDKINSAVKPKDVTNKINEVIDAIPNVKNPTITIIQDGVTKGSFTLNQSSDVTIEIDGASGIVDQEFDPTSIRPQSGIAIAGENYLKEHQSLAGLQLKSNLTTELTENSTDTQYPSAKTVYDNITSINTASHGDWVAKYLEISTTSNGLYSLGSYLPADAEEYWYEIQFHFAGYDKNLSNSNTCELRSYFYYRTSNNDINIGTVSDNSRFFRNTFTLVFPPGSKEEKIPLVVRSNLYESKFYITHTIKLSRTQAFNKFLASAIAYRRLGKTPYTEFPATVPQWLWDDILLGQ